MIRSMTSIAPIAALVLAATLAAPTTADAQTVCGQRDKIIKQLESKYGETRRSVGLQQGRGLVEVFASEETGSWTIVVTDPRGMTCLMAAGEAFQVEQIASRNETPT
ncbi:MAG: hypothetical protein AAF409_18340 [Pseudomonadota bacterium]